VNQNRKILRIVAGGLVGGLASSAAAQPFAINGSGATLLQALLESPAATNDFIDVDGDGVTPAFGTGVDQLAPQDNTAPFDADTHWLLTYRVTGSSNGFAELRDWGFTFAISPDDSDNNATLFSSFSDVSFMNRSVFVDEVGNVVGVGNESFPGANPFVADRSTFLVSTDLSAIDADDDGVPDDSEDNRGMLIDFNPSDVPGPWSVFQEGDPELDKVPTAPGYGNNQRVGVNKETGVPDGVTNRLKDPTGFNGPINFDVNDPDEFTVFSTPITLTPVAPIVNPGVGMHRIEMSNLRHVTATGRLLSGENITKVNRDSGSGTRNAFMNGICLDPSWGAGENIGPRVASSENDLIGPDYQPSNKGGSSRVEGTCINTRLAIGHTGAERGESKGWILGENRALDILAVRSDLKGGIEYARPTIENVIDGSADGFNIIGSGVINTIGDPRSAPATLGGLGFPEPFEDGSNGFPEDGQFQPGENFIDLNNNNQRDEQTEPRPAPGDLNPGPRNEQAAAFVNNITRSIQGFESFSGDPDEPGDLLLFSPGEFLLTQFVLAASADNINDTTPAPDDECVQILDNSDNQNPQIRQLALDNSVLGMEEFASFDFGTTGKVPTRTTGVAYSDGASGGDDFYTAQDGTQLEYGTNLAARNLVAADFNGDGARDINDANDVVEAFKQRFLEARGCPADLTGPGGDGVPDGGLTADDFFFYLGLFSAGDPGADLTGPGGDGVPDGSLTADDFFFYLGQFAAGCEVFVWDAPDGGPGLLDRDGDGDNEFSPDEVTGGLASIEILGDFNGDGNYDVRDVRYWADGLAMVGGQLDRAQGFAAVDNEWAALNMGNNLFGTELANGTYDAGDSRADVSNEGVFRDPDTGEIVGTTRGWEPIGADGVVDCHDIDYVYEQFTQERNPNITDGEATWSDTFEAVFFDLSADMNGDLVVNEEDVRVIVEDILETSFGDVDLDGDCDQADLDIANDTINNGGGTGGWCDGDVNGDGLVNGDDLAIIQGCIDG